MDKNVATIIRFAVIGVVVALLGVILGFVPLEPGMAVGIGAAVGVGVSLFFVRR